MSIQRANRPPAPLAAFRDGLLETGKPARLAVSLRRPLFWLPFFLGALVAGCAHRAGGPPRPPLSNAAQRYAADAENFAPPRFEEDFLEGRLLFQALPSYAPERPRLRAKLLQYLLDPLQSLSADDFRAASGLINHGAATQVAQSLRDALGLYDADVLWAPDGPAIPDGDRSRLVTAARLVRDIYAPRGAELETATALAVLATLQPQESTWRQQLETLLAWSDEGRKLAAGTPSMEGPPSRRQILETIAEAFPAPLVTERLAQAYTERQDRLAKLLRRPMSKRGGDEMGLVGEILMQDSEGLPAAGFGLVGLYARCGQLPRARAALDTLDGQPGDDPELRGLLRPFVQGSQPGPDAFLALARRFLPKLPMLGGTSDDRMDIGAALAILRLGTRHHPESTELLILASRVSRLANAPLLSFRYLEEAEAALARSGASADEQQAVARELFDLAFLLLRIHIDPDDIQPLLRYANSLRSRLEEARKKYGDNTQWLSEHALDLELAKNFVDAGLVDRARPIYDQAKNREDLGVESIMQMATLLMKSGDTRQAIRILRNALERHQPEDPPNETIGFVQEHSKLARMLGVAFESNGQGDEAEHAYRIAVRGWERLFIDHMRRRNRDAAAEAAFEVGRLYYQLNRREEGIAKFMEAISFSESRDQSYIDPLAFLVQRGEVDAALEVYRLAISRPAEAVSEYVKVYASLWVQDLTRRAGRPPEPAAVAFLEHLADRKIHLRPLRATAWYIPLARYAVGRISYQQLSELAHTAGRKAELYFYEAMRRLAEGNADDANALWSRVLQTQMVSFFEFEMAARYLRYGAPSRPIPASSETAETI